MFQGNLYRAVEQFKANVFTIENTRGLHIV